MDAFRANEAIDMQFEWLLKLFHYRYREFNPFTTPRSANVLAALAPSDLQFVDNVKKLAESHHKSYVYPALLRQISSVHGVEGFIGRLVSRLVAGFVYSTK